MLVSCKTIVHVYSVYNFKKRDINIFCNHRYFHEIIIIKIYSRFKNTRILRNSTKHIHYTTGRLFWWTISSDGISSWRRIPNISKFPIPRVLPGISRCCLGSSKLQTRHIRLVFNLNRLKTFLFIYLN